MSRPIPTPAMLAIEPPRRSPSRRAARPLLQWLPLASALWLGACAAPGPHHRNAPIARGTEAPWREANSVVAKDGPHPESGQKYDLAFVEFGEEGSLQDASQRTYARDLIHARPKPLLFIFLHGWHHNASKDDHNVASFKRALQMLALATPSRNVIGVYLGWQGETLKQPHGVNSVLTYYPRKSAAERMADAAPAFRTIGDLLHEANERGSKSLVVGHSFGGLVLERAVKTTLGGLSAKGGNLDFQNTLIVTLNPATEGVLTRQIQYDLAYATQYDAALRAYVRRGTREVVADGASPLMVSITSTNDSATGLLFQTASWIWQFMHPLRGWQKVEVPPGEAQINSPEIVSAREAVFFRQTPGHDLRLVNYQVKDAEKVRAPGDGAAFFANLRAKYDANDLTFLTSDKQQPQNAELGPEPAKVREERYRWRLRPEGGARTPYWIVQVPPRIINNHGGIWSNNNVALLAALYAMKFPQVQGHPAKQEAAPSKLETLPVPKGVQWRQMQSL